MSNLENRINAVIALLLAESPEDKAIAADNLRSIMGGNTEQPQSLNTESEIRRTLLELGVPEHIKGHRYLIRALSALVCDEDLINAVTGELYPLVAKECDTTASRVERAMRHAIEVAWDRCDLDLLYEYFGNTVSQSKGKPTNSEFLARISNVIRLRCKAEV